MSTAPSTRNRIRPAAVAPAESETRPTNRDPVRAVAIGRDGQEISRKRKSNTNPFYIDPRMIPEGWDYQWVTHTVYNMPDTSHQVMMAENGWTPVPAERHAGYFMPPDYKGPIIRDGLMLMERPMILTEEARMEDRQKAHDQKHGARKQFGIQGLSQSFTADTPGARANTYARSSYESGADIPRPQHKISIDDE